MSDCGCSGILFVIYTFIYTSVWCLCSWFSHLAPEEKERCGSETLRKHCPPECVSHYCTSKKKKKPPPVHLSNCLTSELLHYNFPNTSIWSYCSSICSTCSQYPSAAPHTHRVKPLDRRNKAPAWFRVNVAFSIKAQCSVPKLAFIS